MAMGHQIFLQVPFIILGPRTNLALHLGRSPLSHSHGYDPAGDRPTLLARFPLSFVPFMQYAG